MDNDGAINERDLCEAFANCVDLSTVDLDTVTVAPKVLNLVPQQLARKYHIVPISFADNTLVVAMADPAGVNALDDMKFILNVEVRAAICSEEQLLKAIERYYPE